MSLFRTPAEHAANPPESWRIERVASPYGGRARWALRISADQHSPETFATRAQAEEERATGWTRRHYDTETRWYAGEQIANWKPYEQVVAEQERAAIRRAEREGVTA